MSLSVWERRDSYVHQIVFETAFVPSAFLSCLDDLLHQLKHVQWVFFPKVKWILTSVLDSKNGTFHF